MNAISDIWVEQENGMGAKDCGGCGRIVKPHTTMAVRYSIDTSVKVFHVLCAEKEKEKG